MMRVIDIKSYRFAKAYSTDAKSILTVIDLTTRSLKLFQQYKPVLDILHQLNESKSILEAHLHKAEQLLKEGKNGKE